MPKRSILVDIAWCHQKKKIGNGSEIFWSRPATNQKPSDTG